MLAEEAGLPFWRLRALHELGTIELFGHCGTRRLTEAREMAAELGALSTAAVLDLQLTAAGDSRFELAEANRHASDCLAISERLGLPQVRAKALCFLAENAGMRRDREQAEHFIALALAAAGGDRAIEAFCWGASRGMQAVLDDDSPAAMQAFSRAAAILWECPNAEPASFRGLWLVMLAAIGDERAPEEMERARQAGITTAFSNHGMLSYAEAILAGRVGPANWRRRPRLNWPATRCGRTWLGCMQRRPRLPMAGASRRSGCMHRAGPSPPAAWPGWSAGVTPGSASPPWATGTGWA